ncbi:MAG: hypothetical protein LUE17_06310 [Planctomycetaceae bacterium]|nr:hypothetical protein [Planctomycetaceae bacterium]
MRLVKSICTNLVFPASRKDIAAFRDMAAFLKEKGIGCIEFYHDGDGRAHTGKALADLGLDGSISGSSRRRRADASSAIRTRTRAGPRWTSTNPASTRCGTTASASS